jgi:hypothetical protein
MFDNCGAGDARRRYRARRLPRELVAAALCAAAVLAVAELSASSAAARPYNPWASGKYAPRGSHLPFGGPQQAVCREASASVGECLIHVLTPAAGGRTTVVTSPSGLPPNTIKSVYGFNPSSTAGFGQTIALVDAYNDPDAAGDLATFSAQYGLPAQCSGSQTPPSCFDFRQVSQSGGSNLPVTNSSWDLEISLDIEWAHAIAPGANILLVEASSSSIANLLAAEQYAAANAAYVSNSWGSTEFSGESSYDSYLTRPGVSYFAAAGDSASEVVWPSASPDVISVGGTTLSFTPGGTLAQESVWSGSGGGCSTQEAPSPYQQTGSASCAGRRATPDLALDADPNSGVSVYDGVTYDNQLGWWTVGGTSASTVMVAAQAAVSGAEVDAQSVYATPASIPFRDILTGSNGHPALPGYDLATGLGSWSYTPGAPTGLGATTGAGGVALSWNAPTGAAVTQYNVWRGNASGQESTNLGPVSATGPAMTFLDTSATPNATYYYEVQAVNSAGVGPFSNEALAAPPSTPPVASFTTSCSGASCSFASTSTDSQGTIDGYAWNGGNGTTGNASTFSDSYSSATTYTVTLTVQNTAGQSSPAASTKVACTESSSGARRGRVRITCT